MNCLTICQPFAHLICLPDSHPHAKRVENRGWSTRFKGDLLIHAGKSREWLGLDPTGTRDEDYDLPLTEMAFGAIVGVANMVGCLSLTAITTGHVPHELRWLKAHEHVEGPFCFVLSDCRRFATPIPWKGQQGFFIVPDAAVYQAIRKARGVVCP